MEGATISHRPRGALCAALLVLLPLFAPALAAVAAAQPTPLYTSSPMSSPIFSNVTAKAGVQANDSILDPLIADREQKNGFMNGGRGACLIDIDNDGDDDIYVVGPGKNQLFRNDGDFSFVDITDSAGVGDTGYGMACASADLDNDGDQDMIATNYYSHFILYRNNGNSTFTNMTNDSGVDDTGPQTGVAIADFDNDGLLDFFITEYVKTSDRIYRNAGDWNFEDKSTIAHISDLDFGFQPIVADYDGDHDMDVYVANDFGLDTMWQNIGNFSFADVSRVSGAFDTRGGMGTAWGDHNGDGDLDIYVGNYEENGLWDNRGGHFVDVANDSGVDDGWTTWGVVWLDYDNDGDMDLSIANGNVEIAREWLQPNKLFRNEGKGNFTDVSEGSGAESGEVSRGLVAGDLDGDGYVDLYVVNMNCPAVLLENTLENTNAWLRVKLQGRVSNRDGIGAKVTVMTDTILETQVHAAGSSYLSSNSKTLSFGLGNYSFANEVVVDWPSGLRQAVRSVSVNQTLTIVEDDTEDPVARASDLVVDQGEVFALNGTGSTDNVRVVEWNWSINVNGTLRTVFGETTIFVIYDAGLFQGRLVVRDLFNRTGTATFNITVRPHASVSLDAGPDLRIPEGTVVNFVATGSSSVTPNFEQDCTFEWSFNDVAGPVVLTGARPSHFFASPGLYSVAVQVRDPQNATATDVVNITVIDAIPPVIQAAVPSAVDEDTPVWLDAIGTTDNDPEFGGAALFVWSYSGYGGLVSWTGARVLVQFEDPGVFVLTLTVLDAAGNRAERAFTVAVRDTTPPVANAGPDLTVTPGQEAVLSAAASWDNDPAFLTAGQFLWTVSFLSGPEDLSGALQVVAFAGPGLYRVELDAWDPTGNHAPGRDVMYVRVLDEVQPVADAGADRTVRVGETFELDASMSSDNDPTLLTTGSFLWEFQDGAVRKALRGLRAEYAFERAGAYSIRLTVTDQAGNSGAVVFKVTAVDLDPPVLAVVPLPLEIEAGQALALNASGTTDNVGVASITWRLRGPFDFDSKVIGPTGQVVLTIAGVYSVTVTAKDAAGNAAVATFNVTVTPRTTTGGGGTGGNTPGGGGPDSNGGDPGGQEPQTPQSPAPVSSPIGAVLLASAAGAVLVVWLLARRRAV